MARVGNLPTSVGQIDVPTDEMMFWMYCPIKVKDSLDVVIPDTLKQFSVLISAAMYDYVKLAPIVDKYVYITAKTLWVSGDYIGNRPGWHCDGFGTNDINYIWADRAPTDFVYPKNGELVDVSDDCEQSMIDMTALADKSTIVRYHDRELLRLDPTVVHRSPVNFAPGMRTFIKVSISPDKYNLVGNSINYDLPEFYDDVDFVPRAVNRNHPIAK